MSVTRDPIRANILAGSLCLVAEAIAEEEPVDQIRTTALKSFANRDTQLEITTPGGTVVDVWTKQDHAKGSGLLYITPAEPLRDDAGVLTNALPLAADIAVDSGIAVSGEYRQAESLQASFEFQRRISQLRIELCEEIDKINNAGVVDLKNELGTIILNEQGNPIHTVNGKAFFVPLQEI
ncbi:MAG: hypothetical protein RhofKO_39840 [Rhodothermales bacterium]